MSKYLKTPDNVLSSDLLMQSLHDYLLDELLPAIRQFSLSPSEFIIRDNGREILQKILDNSNHQLRIYGSAQELAENLKIWRDFPFAHEFFKTETDLFELNEVTQLKSQLAAGNFADYASKFPVFEGNSRSKAEESELCRLLKQNHAILGETDGAGIMTQVMNNSILIKCLSTIIENNPKMFSEKGVTAVRVFEDGSQRFVMKAELFHAISNGNKLKDDEYRFTTISMEEVERIYGHRVKNIEFLRTPIIRARHRAVFVKAHLQGDFCTLATDVLFDLLRSLIIEYKVFQKYNPIDWIGLSKLFDLNIKMAFNVDCKTPYFLRHGSWHLVTCIYANLFDCIEHIPAKDIRNAKIDGFTVQNLKNELIHLGLTMAFPEIVNHAEAVYSAVDGQKRGKYLNTSDLFDAVFHSQIICIFNRYPKFKTFIHNQSGCERVLGYTCEMCQKMSDDQKSLEQKQLESLENKTLSLKEFETMKRKILELEDENRKLKDQNSRFSSQVKELKLEKLSINSENPSTNFSVVSTKTSISECLICDSELDTTGETKKCPMCRTRFHSKCAIEYIKHEIKCPSCKGTLRNSMITSKFS
uniref:RING-type domain-containing protein n=1 Tax=Caenorhabditis tropicalis TaxID=1561998 RepID=A0A1I7TGR9_9PELO